MAKLFGRNKLKEKADQISTDEILPFIEIIKKWHSDYHHGTLKKDKETSREQSYNQDFFMKILGYNEKPASPFSFEPKATTDKGQLPDAVISYNGENISAVVELKGASIPLDRPQQREGNMSPVQQAFKYKTQYRRCPFVIVSNFYEFRLYQDNQLDYEIWTLDELIDPANDYANFKSWYVLLKADNFITKDGASKTESLLSEVRVDQEQISKKFYTQYKETRLDLLRDLWKNNKEVRDNIDFGIEKAQKIIDRIVFVCFAEDTGLLPDDILRKVVESAKNSMFGGSLWSALKGFFDAIDHGSEKLEIPNGYNGGLFKTDNELNALRISDDALQKVVSVGNYDFAEQLSVTILGHIFEQSISDLEEIKAKAEQVDELKDIAHSRRKKDGIFYTPDYIVHYIVDNSLGAYLREHEEKFKVEAGLKGDITDKNYTKRERQAYTNYQTFLQDVKVVDPACGSGAFLVYVFDYLFAENKRVAEILGTLFTEDYARSILQNNIYGVDLNEESVEITKLSLWLKTAQKGKKLTALDKNIKCGNSLIDDPAVAGKKAFNWQEEFKEVFKNGGFDIVVGNPPYVDSESMVKNIPEERYWLTKNYEVAKGNWDLFVLFIQKGVDLLKQSGYASMIVPNKILSAPYAKATRSYVANNYSLVGLTDVTKEGVFDVDVYPVITNIKNSKDKKRLVVTEGVETVCSRKVIKNENLPENWAFLLSKTDKISYKVPMAKIGDIFNVAAAATVAEAYELKEIISENSKSKSGKIINTGTIDPYYTTWGVHPIKYIKSRYLYPVTDYTKMKEKNWYNVDKIIIAGMAIRLEACWSRNNEYLPAKSTTVVYSKDGDSTKLKALLVLLNSRYLSFIFRQENGQLSMAGGYMNINKNNISSIQIPIILNQKALSDIADRMIDLSYESLHKKYDFQQLVTTEFGKIKLPNNWWDLDFASFVTSIKIKLTLDKKDELLPIWKKYQSVLSNLSTQISDLNTQIDTLIYGLYGLTEDEIKIIEER
ncbi:MAG: N-6 DNA methylase [Candidatus Nomurabacteria bacterium]|jgi:hypothetical protein|nr:N-6 DNA methylase [Candidatus Nomurabacteria bacterium]